MKDQNFKNLFLSFLFLKKIENPQINIMKFVNFFVFVLYFTKRRIRCSPIKPQSKVKKEDGREAP